MTATRVTSALQTCWPYWVLRHLLRSSKQFRARDYRRQVVRRLPGGFDSQRTGSRHVRLVCASHHRLPPSRAIKSHEPDTPTCWRVYLVRDPWDFAASYLPCRERAYAQDSSVPLEVFAIPFRNGLGTRDLFGSWGDRVTGWLRWQRDDDLPVICYEDLLADTGQEIERVATFYAISTDTRAIADAIANSSREKMRSSEQTQAKVSGSLHFRDGPILFVASRREGAGRAQMDSDTLGGFESKLGRVMRSRGYL